MTIELEVEEGFDWQYEEEEYPIYCNVHSDLFNSKPVGEPVVILHHFGGSYGEVKFLLKASEATKLGQISVTLINKWGGDYKVCSNLRYRGQNCQRFF